MRTAYVTMDDGSKWAVEVHGDTYRDIQIEVTRILGYFWRRILYSI